MTIRSILLAGAALAIPGLARAQPVTGLYVAGGGGLNWAQGTDLSVRGNTGLLFDSLGISREGKATFDLGWAALGSLGYGFGNGLRTEIEGFYRSNEVDRVSGFNGVGPIGNPRGTQRTYGVMGNVLYDLAIPGLFLPVQPYIGGGIGIAWTDWDGVRATALASGATVGINDTAARFAYQGIAGAALNVPSVPGLAITAEYRFLGTLQNRFDSTVTIPGLGSVRGRAEAENYNHSLLLGIRYAFSQPRPPAPAAFPAPAAAPAPARTYLVFFDWDRADLTDRARQIIADAANASRTANVTRLEVAGHADRSGTPQYNQRLSERRAEVVAAELARNGVPRDAISVQAFGESRPLVPTADGVREPQNRRVEIVLR